MMELVDMTDLKSVGPKGRTGSTPVPATNSNQTTMNILDYPEFVVFKRKTWVKDTTQEFLITVDHPVIKYFGVDGKGDASLFDKDENSLCTMPLIKDKKFDYDSFKGGDGWTAWANFSLRLKSHIDCTDWDVERRAINQLFNINEKARFAVAAVFVYQQLKHKYEMENLTREFSSFRSTFEQKLDKLIKTMANQPVVEEESTPVEVKQEPIVELKVEKSKPLYTAETVFKKAKNHGIASTAEFYGISEDKVRELKVEYRTKMKSK